jgi:hypothetical protein
VGPAEKKDWGAWAGFRYDFGDCDEYYKMMERMRRKGLFDID